MKVYQRRLHDYTLVRYDQGRYGVLCFCADELRNRMSLIRRADVETQTWYTLKMGMVAHKGPSAHVGTVKVMRSRHTPTIARSSPIPSSQMSASVDPSLEKCNDSIAHDVPIWLPHTRNLDSRKKPDLVHRCKPLQH